MRNFVGAIEQNRDDMKAKKAEKRVIESPPHRPHLSMVIIYFNVSPVGHELSCK